MAKQRFLDNEEKKNQSENFRVWVKALLSVVLVLSFFKFLQGTGWPGEFGVSGGKLTLGISFLVGVAASLSSCLAVVGGIVIAFSEKYPSYAKAAEDKPGGQRSSFGGAIIPNIKFHVGRIATFFVLGGILGLIGGSINLGGNFISAYTIIIAVVMGWLGLSILGIVPSISSLGLRPPKFVLRFWGKIEDSEHQAAPYFLGGITFFLPCGFTQSMQIFALSSGGFWSGAIILAVFALGTMPVLLALGLTASWASFKKIAFINKAAGIIIILFAIYTFNSGVALFGTKRNVVQRSISSNPEIRDTSEEDEQILAMKAQIIEMKITNRGFEPSIIPVKKSIPVQFVVNGDGATGCTNKIVIPDLGIEKDIKKGENIIEFTPKKLGPMAYSCWMGMVRGKFIVE